MLLYRCPSLPDLQNGDVIVNGNKAMYTCDDGYSLIGSSQRKCFVARWFGNAPVCVASKLLT